MMNIFLSFSITSRGIFCFKNTGRGVVWVEKRWSRAAFLNRRVVADFKRVVGLVQNYFYIEHFCGMQGETSLEEGLQMMKVLRCGS